MAVAVAVAVAMYLGVFVSVPVSLCLCLFACMLILVQCISISPPRSVSPRSMKCIQASNRQCPPDPLPAPPLPPAGQFFDPALAPHALQGSSACLLAASPHTGRTHQIRLHGAAAWHALLGDELYGVTLDLGLDPGVDPDPCISRQALHVVVLELLHPMTGEALRLAAPVPDDSLAAAAACGLAVPDVRAVPELWV